MVAPAPARCVLQVRMSSARLPGKAMLPLAGMPMCVLCARRIGCEGLPLVVATSVSRDDDAIVDALSAAGIATYRGSLEDVRSRFLAAVADMPPEAVCVRLTGDNAFPDAAFIRLCLAHFCERDVGYLGVGNGTARDGLPYGMACEVFRIGDLRRAAVEVDTPREREHVTPAVRALYAADPRGDTFAPLGRDLSHLRCTVDTPDDYWRVAGVFHGISDPIRASWHSLCERLADVAAVQ